jgi:hypothetical protein
MLKRSSFLRVAGVLLLAGATLLAQVQTTPVPAKASSAKAAPAKIKLTADQQRGLRLLKQAETQAASLEPDMRAFVLWRVSVGYSRIDRDKSDRVLHQAFVATQSMEQGPEDENSCQESSTCRNKLWLQTGLLNAISQRSPDQALQLLPEADPVPRRQAAAALADLFTKKKDFPQALSLLTGVADQNNYPFETAADLFLALPKESPDRMALFSQAQQNFANRNTVRGGFPQNEFAGMVLRIWRQLPPPTVLSAVDDVLQEGKDKEDKSDSFHVRYLTKDGSVSFNSPYQLRVFQMLPILDELDHERAQSLLRENAEAQSTLAKYPQGMQSLDPGMFQDHPGDPSKSAIHGMLLSLGKPDPSQSSMERVQDELERQINTVSSEASSNPKQALADAMNLPASNPIGPPGLSSPRALVLMKIANAAVEKNPAIAKSALDELRKNLDSITPFQKGRDLSECAGLYLKLGEIDSARKCLEELRKAAEQAYKEDTDASDPNQAFKAQWPSTALWIKDMNLSARISPDLVEQANSSISDPEIATAVRVAYADALIGVPDSISQVERRHKNGQYITSLNEP